MGESRGGSGGGVQEIMCAHKHHELEAGILQGPLKWEILNRFYLISEERVRTKQWKIDENRLKNKEVMTLLKVHKLSWNISGNIDMNMQMSELMMS